ncbi:MAG: stage II sporulation protein M [Oscillospiraceae bacterium]|nr:stage II sporulation protein M [Oscillospiraceae bacterium]
MKLLTTLPTFASLLRRLGWRNPSRLPGGGKKNSRWAETLAHSWQKLVLLGLFALGLFLGAKTAGSGTDGWQTRLTDMLRAQRLERAELRLFASALRYFGTDFLFLSASFLLGLCAAGLPFLLLLPVLRGLGVGVVSGWLYLHYSASGVGYSMLVLYPAVLVSVLIMLETCKDSMCMSGDMLLLVTGKLERAESPLRRYVSRYAAPLLCSALAAVLDALCFAAFHNVFQI